MTICPPPHTHTHTLKIPKMPLLGNWNGIFIEIFNWPSGNLGRFPSCAHIFILCLTACTPPPSSCPFSLLFSLSLAASAVPSQPLPGPHSIPPHQPVKSWSRVECTIPPPCPPAAGTETTWTTSAMRHSTPSAVPTSP